MEGLYLTGSDHALVYRSQRLNGLRGEIDLEQLVVDVSVASEERPAFVVW
jgi:hypothetical protein